ncbi:MAG: hypothetical protein K0S74_298 [Chlamydiales bacterium]|jgi:cell division protein FtsL|nr:hypothetical protein [Chlamydiales bacterium]
MFNFISNIFNKNSLGPIQQEINELENLIQKNENVDLKGIDKRIADITNRLMGIGNKKGIKNKIE